MCNHGKSSHVVSKHEIVHPLGYQRQMSVIMLEGDNI